MLRRIKAIYVFPLFVILLGVGNYFGYTKQFEPTKGSLETARAGWEKARSDMRTAEKDYPTHLSAQVDSAKQLIAKRQAFVEIQNAMPNLWNLSAKYPDPKVRLREWYRIMGTGGYIRELDRMYRGFKMGSPQTNFVQDRTLTFDNIVEMPKVIKFSLGNGTFTATSMEGLAKQILMARGYGPNGTIRYPMVITLRDSNFGNNGVDVIVDKSDPYQPKLRLNYTAEGYFMTRGWDPYPDIQGQLAEWQSLVNNPPQPKPPLTSLDSECPSVFWIFKAKDTGV